MPYYTRDPKGGDNFDNHPYALGPQRSIGSRLAVSINWGPMSPTLLGSVLGPLLLPNSHLGVSRSQGLLYEVDTHSTRSWSRIGISEVLLGYVVSLSIFRMPCIAKPACSEVCANGPRLLRKRSRGS